MSADEQRAELPRLAYSMDELHKATGLSRNRLYEAVKSKALKTFVDGRRRFATEWAAREFLETLEFGGGRKPRAMTDEARAALRQRREAEKAARRQRRASAKGAA